MYIDWSEVLITEFFDHLEVLSLEIESEAKRLIYYNYIDYLRRYYFSNHCWTNMGNNFAHFENVLLRIKEFKKNYILQKADKMGDDRMRLRPKSQIQRAERRESLISTFHNLRPDEKLTQLLDTLKKIGFA